MPAHLIAAFLFISLVCPYRVPKSVPDLQLNRAAAEWSRALGREIPLPILHRGVCRDPVLDVACADRLRYVITVQNTRGVDRYTAYLHEMGHLLGVNHIVGDPVMDDFYQGPALHITPAAVKQAKRRLPVYEHKAAL
jgi:hypothetical protein